MFSLVASKRQERSFRRTWEFFCRKYGWGNDPYAIDGIRYVLLRGGRMPWLRRRTVGTIEFVPYRPGNPRSTVEGPYKHPFSAEPEIRDDPYRIWEIDKLCIAEAYQRQGHFGTFLEIFYDHAERFAPRCYVALVERRLYRMLRIVFGLAVEQRGPAMQGPTSALIPVLFDIGRIMQNKAEVARLLGEAKRRTADTAAGKPRARRTPIDKRV
ncbi:hypothetical protein [Cohnella sp. JJ-181]|uniref:hypothetical protein n=1 Tax=Cohnella rhizoplanae TaxID=2974897 RepID=UPI0022FF5C38|nr:hypothetical protein [Cohnella sp. JJ-181]CAI6087424.1 hypothetical protein COHCIP112018_05522 [Cohnella sp. JJ-181]